MVLVRFLALKFWGLGIREGTLIRALDTSNSPQRHTTLGCLNMTRLQPQSETGQAG